MENQIETVLKHTFQLEKLQPIQKDAILATLDGKDCCVLMPSGSGKSLCYQLPAVLDEGITIVIIPYLCSVKAELDYLRSLEIKADTFAGFRKLDEYIDLLKKLKSDKASDIRLLYFMPEKFFLENCVSNSKMEIKRVLRSLYERKLIARFVIDEAANILLWGNNFREHYFGLDSIRTEFPDVPIMFTTSNIPNADIRSIKKILNISNCKYFCTDPYRLNINCIMKEKNQNTISDIINEIKQKFKSQNGIIYCRTIEECNDIAFKLSCEGIQAIPYHAHPNYLEPLKTDIFKKWLTNEVDVICATVALGSGLTKCNIRFVFHYTMTKSVEEYFLQTHLAGHDGQSAHCILYYSEADFHLFEFLIKNDGCGERVILKRLQKLTELKELCQKSPIDFRPYFNKNI